MTKVICSDFDGVIVRKFTKDVLTGVEEALVAIEEHGAIVAVATNQQGLWWRYLLNDDKYPDAQELARRFHAVMQKVPVLAKCVWLVSVAEDERIVRLLYERELQVPSLLAELSAEDKLREVEGMAKYYTYALARGLYKALRSLDISNVVILGDRYYRKPSPGMLEMVQRMYNIPMQSLFALGDRDVDSAAAESAGCVYGESFADALDWLKNE